MSSLESRLERDSHPPSLRTSRTRHIAYYIRHPGNLHYFASVKPYLDRLRENPSDRHLLVVVEGIEQMAMEAEYEGYQELFTEDANLDQYDLVVTPTFLRPHERSARTRAVQVFHGMSDKPFTYERDFSDYLLCLCAGQRQADRLLANPKNRNVKCALVGYPKFDSIPHVPELFDNDKKTLIYCPTWRKEGISSIERFLVSPETIDRLARRYNLIIKPHPNILNPARKHYDPPIVESLEGLARTPGVRLVRSGNAMSWFVQADLFIGDISTAGYEWLYFDRPMVFLNPKPGQLRSTSNADGLTYLWQCGAVCDAVENLPDIVGDALNADFYSDMRQRLLHSSVYNPRQGGAAARGAAEIERLLS